MKIVQDAIYGVC